MNKLIFLTSHITLLSDLVYPGELRQPGLRADCFEIWKPQKDLFIARRISVGENKLFSFRLFSVPRSLLQFLFLTRLTYKNQLHWFRSDQPWGHKYPSITRLLKTQNKVRNYLRQTELLHSMPDKCYRFPRVRTRTAVIQRVTKSGGSFWSRKKSGTNNPTCIHSTPRTKHFIRQWQFLDEYAGFLHINSCCPESLPCFIYKQKECPVYFSTICPWSYQVSKSTYSRNCKGKSIPLQASTGPEGFRKFRLPDFKTIGT
jgi:hypothetical protein